MKINKMILIVLLIAPALFSLFFFSVQFFTLKTEMDKHELETTNAAVSKFRYLLKEAEKDLLNLSSNLAVCDDTFNFVNNSQDNVFKKGIESELRQNKELDFYVIFDYLGEQIISGMYNKSLNIESWIQFNIADYFSVSEIYENGNLKIRSGLIRINSDTYFIAASEILPMDKGKKSNGVLILGKKLEEEALRKEFKEISFKHIKKESNLEKIQKTIKIDKISFYGNDKIEYISYLSDIFQKKILEVKIVLPRNLNSIWIKSQIIVWTMVLIFLILLSVLMYKFFNTLVAKPISLISNSLENFNQEKINDNNYEKEYIARNDEIGGIARSITRMKKKIIDNYYEIKFHNENLERKIEERTEKLISLNKAFTISEDIIRHTSDGVCVTKLSGEIIKVNKAFCIMSGYSEEELLGKNPRILKSNRHDSAFYNHMWECILKNGSWQGEIWDRKKNGAVYPKWLSINTILGENGKAEMYISTSIDIAKLKIAEEEIRHLAYYDSLTGLPNRFFFREVLEKSINRALRNNKNIGLMFMDLDRFKYINDTMGHSVGDKVLIEVARRLKGVLKSLDTISRLGGDEFTIILEDINCDYEIKPIAERIIKAVSMPINIGGKEVFVGASIGIALAPIDDSTSEGLLMKADAAMYSAKELGKGRFAFYSHNIQMKNNEYMETERILKRAITNNSFTLLMQPKILNSNGLISICGAEVFLRIVEDDGTYIYPEKFLKVAEETGFIIQIGKWVIDETARIVSNLKQHGINIPISFNISNKECENMEIVEQIKSVIRNNKISASDLEIEITEAIFKQNAKIKKDNLTLLHDFGVKIAIDNFGTGCSSFGNISEISFDTLKIDKSFSEKLQTNSENKLFAAIVGIGKGLMKDTVVKGIETKEQYKIVSLLEPIICQGYYFSEALEFNMFVEYFHNFTKNRG